MPSISPIGSRTIDLLRFPLIVGIVMIHCCQFSEGSHTGIFITQVFGEGFSRSCVPLFFAISGYLFFLSKERTIDTYFTQLRKRVRTLLLPYLLWNIIFMIWDYLRFYYLSSFFPNMEKPPLHIVDLLKYTFWGAGEPNPLFYEPFNSPVDVPLWFIRDLIVMCIIAPLFYFLLRGRKGLLILVVIMLCFVCGIGPHISGFEPTAVCFFALGAFFGIHEIDPVATVLRMKKSKLVFLSILWGCLCVADVSLYPDFWGQRLHGLGIFVGVPVLVGIAAILSSRNIMLPQIVVSSTFFVYGAHSAIIRPLMKCITVLNPPNNAFLLVLDYFGLVIVVTGLCFGVYIILKAIAPGVASLLTGGRNNTRQKKYANFVGKT